MKNSLILAPICLVLSMLFSTNASGTLRCGMQLVTIDNTKAEVLKKCGEPSWTEYYQEEIWPERSAFAVAKITKELWVYNRGPQQFLRYLNFANGRLISITLGDYGFYENVPRAPCTPEEFAASDSKTEIVLKCGLPFIKDSREEYRVDTINGVTRRRTVIVDEWTYDFGPTRFMRILRFENGKLVDVQRGERGG